MTITHQVGSPRSTALGRPGVLLIGLALALLWLPSCGDEEAPGPEVLTLRELLGLSSQRIAEMDPTQKATFAKVLAQAWESQALENSEPEYLALPQELRVEGAGADQSPLAYVQVHDGARADLGLEVLLNSSLLVSGDTVRRQALAVNPGDLGVVLDGLLVLDPKLDPHFSGQLFFAETWSVVETEGLAGRSERERAEDLSALWESYLGFAGVEAMAVLVVPAPRAPMAILYAPANQALFVNPNLLYLFGEAGGRSQSLGVREMTLVMPFVDLCVRDEQQRCDACFGLGGDPNGAECAALFEGDDASAECDALALSEQEGFRLLCLSRAANLNQACLMTGDPAGACAATEAATDLQGLEGARPLLTDEACQQLLADCEAQRIAPAPVPPSPATPPPLPPSGNHHNANNCTNDCADECLSQGCEVGLSVLFEIACQACVDSASEGDSGGCGSACEGDSVQDSGAEAPNQGAIGVVFALPFIFLFGVWWKERP